MRFETLGDAKKPAVLFFHAMGVTGESSEPVARYLEDRYFCILPTSTVYCPNQHYESKAAEVRQVEDFLRETGIERLALVCASSLGADLALAFLAQTKIPVEHVLFDGGQFAQIGKGTRRIMTPFLYFAIKSLYWSKGGTLKKSCGVTMKPSGSISSPQARRCTTGICAARWRTVWRINRFRRFPRSCKRILISSSAA